MEDLILSIRKTAFCGTPSSPTGVAGSRRLHNAAIFDRELLLRLTADGVSHGQYSINGVISEQARSNNVYCYRCGGWSYHIHNLTEYFAANMALLDEKVRQELFLPERPILTKIRDEAPAKYGLSSSVKNSLVADGCIIEGTVENSVIFRGVKIGQGAVVKNSIIMQSTVVNNNAELEYVVLDKDVLIKDGRRLAGYLTYPLYVPKKSHI